MGTNKKEEKERVYKSMTEFEKDFFPKSCQERTSETEMEPSCLDISSADHLLQKTRRRERKE